MTISALLPAKKTQLRVVPQQKGNKLYLNLRKETPRQEILRLLDEVIEEYGPSYVYIAPGRHAGYFHHGKAGCIVGALLLARGPVNIQSFHEDYDFGVRIAAPNFVPVGFLAYTDLFPVSWKSELGLLSQIQSWNDNNVPWGMIRDSIKSDIPAAA